MKTSEVLYAAADHIAEFGHWKGETAPACVIGAIVTAKFKAGARGSDLPAIAAVHDYVGDCVPRWSDAPERTAAEVVETLRACALIEAAKETEVVVVAAREGVAV